MMRATGPCVCNFRVSVCVRRNFRLGFELPTQRTVAAFDRTYTISVNFQPRGFYDVPRVFIENARAFQALAAILDWLTQVALISCWYRSDARQDEVRLQTKAALLWISKVRDYEHVCSRWSAKKLANPCYKGFFLVIVISVSNRVHEHSSAMRP